MISFESVRVLVMRLTNQGDGRKISLPEMNARINELLKQSVKSEGVLNLFSDVKAEFSLFDSKFLEEVAGMKERNLAAARTKWQALMARWNAPAAPATIPAEVVAVN